MTTNQTITSAHDGAPVPGDPFARRPRRTSPGVAHFLGTITKVVLLAFVLGFFALPLLWLAFWAIPGRKKVSLGDDYDATLYTEKPAEGETA